MASSSKTNNTLVLIRCDASPQIGMGHIMRCMTIAIELRNLNIEVVFVKANRFGNYALIENGFHAIVLNTEYDNMLSEIEMIEMVIKSNNPRLIIIDSYFATDDYLMYIERFVPTMYIDGLYQCQANITALLNYNAAADKEEYEKRFVGKKTRLLVGTEYVPVRKQFLTSKKKVIKKHSENVLITTGSTDNFNVIPVICDKISEKLNDLNVNLHVVIGSLFSNSELIKSQYSNQNHIIIHEGLTDLHAIMELSDIAVTGAGTTVYELLAMGVPSIVFGINDIQMTVEKLAPSIIWAGDLRNDAFPTMLSTEKVNALTEMLIKLLSDHKKRTELSKYAIDRVDGKGANRIADMVLSLCV